MRPALRLLSRYHITLFTRQNCSLCDDAEHVLSKVWDKQQFECSKIDVMSAGQEKWKNVYEFDTPVIHVDKIDSANQTPETSTSAPKLMHRFSVEQVEQLMKR